MEGEGISDVRDFFRKKLVRLGVVEPTEAEAEELAALLQGQQDPNAIFLQAAAEEAIAKAARARADTVKTVADAELSRAKTIETLSNVDAKSAELSRQITDRFPDWGNVMQSSPAQITQEMEMAMRQMPDPHMVAYALAKNPELADQIAQLPDGQQGQVIAQMAKNMEAANA